MIALYLPLAYIGSLYWGITGLFAGAAAGNVIAGIIAYRVIRKVCASEDEHDTGDRIKHPPFPHLRGGRPCVSMSRQAVSRGLPLRGFLLAQEGAGTRIFKIRQN